MGTAVLYFLPPGTTMNGKNYLNLLQRKLELHMTVHNCQIFMHDGAPCHRSMMVKKFLDEKSIQMLGGLKTVLISIQSKTSEVL